MPLLFELTGLGVGDIMNTLTMYVMQAASAPLARVFFGGAANAAAVSANNQELHERIAEFLGDDVLYNTTVVASVRDLNNSDANVRLTVQNSSGGVTHIYAKRLLYVFRPPFCAYGTLLVYPRKANPHPPQPRHRAHAHQHSALRPRHNRAVHLLPLLLARLRRRRQEPRPPPQHNALQPPRHCRHLALKQQLHRLPAAVLQLALLLLRPSQRPLPLPARRRSGAHADGGAGAGGGRLCELGREGRAAG